MKAGGRLLVAVGLAAMTACAPVRVSGPRGPRPSIAPDEKGRTIDVPELGIRVTLGDVMPIMQKGEANIQGGAPDGHMSAEAVDLRTEIFFTCWDGRVQLSCRTEEASIDQFDSLAGLYRSDGGRFRSVMPGPVDGDPHESGYAALQSTWRDPATGVIHAWYHAEVFLRGAPTCAAYSSIGYATSTDDGRSFTKRGIVLTSPYPRDDSRCLAQGVQGPKVIEAGPDLYMFFTIDHAVSSELSGIGIARASKDDAGTWYKYHDGAFDEPGIGGQVSPLIQRGGRNAGIWHAVVSWNEYLNRYLMLHTDYSHEGAIYLRTSTDMIRWSAAALVVPPSSEYGYRYPTLFGVTDDVTARDGWLYFGRTRRGGGIGPDTLLARRRFSLERRPR